MIKQKVEQNGNGSAQARDVPKPLPLRQKISTRISEEHQLQPPPRRSRPNR